MRYAGLSACGLWILACTQVSFTNHVGGVVSGTFGGVTNGSFVVSGRVYPLSVLPKHEQRRARAMAGLDVRTAAEKRIDADLAYELKRIDARFLAGDITAEEAEKLRTLQRNSAAHRRGK